MIDVHAHLNHLNFSPEVCDRIIDNAKKAGYSGYIYPALGLHPVQTMMDKTERSVNLDDYDQWEPTLKKAITDKTICCVGEVGLDFSPHIIRNNERNNPSLSEDELKDIQREVFRRQINLAVAADLPVNVHSRSAGHHALTVLRECNAKRVIMHAFDGKPSYAKQAVTAGYHFSVPPSVVRSPQKQALVAAVPLSHLLLESDSPALGPEKGVDNEPANIILAAEEIARIKQISVDEVVGFPGIFVP
ncbi:uncharacterized protein BYT42DRAFT_611321 [Radiomyces spectabilis]|uniref:uncharacterized protein n=1 Tax=Radiomyces spectabilis TaxID=64574 RepID=UPI002220B0D1|nr:uncharacterized protein BYT42DRAFT_611321 [Radiomyces spectabilis]KAI8388250.1 hypothetical protein BYT42DRAFT_611321 [Radiomyces spectabilis]